MTIPHLSARARRLKTSTLFAALVALTPSIGHACGACAEDKVAATYDYQVVQRAAAAGDVMVFCEVTGVLDRQRLTQAARRLRGIRVVSIRTSTQPAALSFAIDPARQSPQAAVAAMQRSLPSGIRLTIVRQMESSPRGT